MNVKYNPGSVFQGVIVNKKKTRKRKPEKENMSTSQSYHMFSNISKYLRIYMMIYDLRVTEVWFLKKKDNDDEFEDFHYDYKNIGGGSNDVSFTVNVNLGKLNEANDIATMKILPANKESSILSRSRREEMMQKLSVQEKEKID